MLSQFESEMAGHAREWLVDVRDGKRELTPVDLAGIAGTLFSLKVRKHPDNTPIPDEFVLPGSKGELGLSYVKSYKPSSEQVGLRYTDDAGIEREIQISGSLESYGRQFVQIDQETGAQIGEPTGEIPRDLVPGITNELLIGLNYFDKPAA